MDEIEDHTSGLSELFRLQNRDGGWGHVPGGSSWTEPTGLALLALRAWRETGFEYTAGLRWLRGLVRSDGGYAPHPSVETSSWVTCLALLLAPEDGIAAGHAIGWVMQVAPRDSNRLRLLYLWLRGSSDELAMRRLRGWSWFPETTAWVTPTALTVLALEHARKAGIPCQEDVRMRADEGRRSLLARMCPDGGWNYGAKTALGVNLAATPETTGQALLALAGATRVAQPTAAVANALLRNTRSPAAAAWLRLGLHANGLPAAGAGHIRRAARTRIIDVAMPLLWAAAAEGRNVFREAAS